jgi:hypothetical protein
MKNSMIAILVALFFLATETKGNNNSTESDKNQQGPAQSDGIRPYSKNPWYWEYKQQPILLRGGSDNDNLWQWTGSKLTEHLDLLISVGGNYVRNTMSDRDEGDIYAFKEVRKGVYDLSEWNNDYSDRLEFFLSETSKRDIIVQLSLWDHIDINSQKFPSHPWNPANNVNWNVGLVQNQNDFFEGSFRGNEQQVIEFQKKYISKLASFTLKYDHILYNIDNETSYSVEWQNFWAAYFQEQADKAGKEIYITSMNMVPSTGVRQIMANRDLYSFVEISQNNQDSKGGRGKAHYNNIIKWRRIIELDERGPMPMNNEKIYGAADGRNYSAGSGKEAEDRLWKNVFAGAASARFHRPEGYWGSGLTERPQINLNAMTKFLEEFDIFSASPYEGIHHVWDSEAYALANIGKEYAVYFPAGRYSVELDPWIMVNKVSIKFLDIDSGEWSEERIVEVKWEEELSGLFGFQRGISLTTPGNRPCVAILRVLE